jgi:hypothetical protein
MRRDGEARVTAQRHRRLRPTLRCLREDLQLDLPDADVDIGTLDHPLIKEARRIAPASPTGQKRILSIEHPLVFRIRASDARGATWLEQDPAIVWLCAARLRQEGSDDDAFAWFAELHATDRLLPTNDDRIRDRLEAGHRLELGLTRALLAILDDARTRPREDVEASLGGWLPARMLVAESGGVEEIWCGLGLQAADGSWVRPELRDVLFASLERALQPTERESRADWPTGEVPWAEVVCLYVREAV